MEQEIYNKEYSVGKILSESWKKFKENFQLILLITLVIYIPINIILSFVPVNTLMEQRGDLQGFKAYTQIIQILEGFIGIIASMAIAYIIKSKIDGKTISFGQALKKSWSRWPTAIGTNFILGIFLLGLTLMLIIPGIIVGIILGVPYLFLPENFFTHIIMGTFSDVVFAYFTVISVVFFINFDSTKKNLA